MGWSRRARFPIRYERCIRSGGMTGLRERGMSLIELMIVVAIIGILASVAVFMYTRYVDKARIGEVKSALQHFAAQERTFHSLNGEYLCTNAACSESTLHPDISGGEGPYNIGSPTPIPSSWRDLKINLDVTQYCGYTAVAGFGQDGTNVGTIGSDFGVSATPAQDWFYVIADCPFVGKRFILSSETGSSVSWDYL